MSAAIFRLRRKPHELKAEATREKIDRLRDLRLEI
jgi:hypothetical protein